MKRANSMEQTLMLEKIEGRRRRRQQRIKWLDGVSNSTNMSLSNSGRLWRTGKPGVLQSMGSHRVRHDRATDHIFSTTTMVVGLHYLDNLPMIYL